MSAIFQGKVFLMVGKLPKSQEQAIPAGITSNGGKTTTDLENGGATHVLISVPSDTRQKITREASAKGLPVLIRDYITECIDANKLLDEKDYLQEVSAERVKRPSTVISNDDDDADVSPDDAPTKAVKRKRSTAAVKANPPPKAAGAKKKKKKAAAMDIDDDDNNKDAAVSIADDDDDDYAGSDKDAGKGKKRARKTAEKKEKDDDEEKKKKQDEEKKKKDDDDKLKAAMAVTSAPTYTPKTSTVTKKIIKKGGASVDPICEKADICHIYQESSDKIWKATLNQTNIKDNNNKFYMIQLLQEDANPNNFYIWNRWGRVGNDGQNKLVLIHNLEAAKLDFKRKFRDKTTQEWNYNADYIKKPGKYMVIDIDEADDPAKPDSPVPDLLNPEPPKQEPLKSKLHPSVQKLIEFISDVKLMNDALMSFEIDVVKCPLGKLSSKTIGKAEVVLKKIEDLINGNKFGKNISSELEQLSSEFYTLIPTVVGMHRLPIIQDVNTVQKKQLILDQLRNIDIAATIIKDSSDNKLKEHPIDSKFNSLHIKLVPLEPDSLRFKQIQNAVINTIAATHYMKLKIVDVWELEREGERERFEPWKDNENRQILWHGSRSTNWMGILSKGLLIAPPSAPVTGYMFGKGVYFADMISKSANYCYAHTSGGEGIMMLSEVALGKTFDLTGSMYMEKPQPGTQSTFGQGRYIPDPAGDIVLENGAVLHAGRQIDRTKQSNLLYNEMIVYDVSQIRTCFLLRLKFN